VAAVIGALAALPAFLDVHIGTVGLTPEIALLAGNLLAFALARPVGATLTFRGGRSVGARTVEFAFDTDRAVQFRAGQYLELTLPHGRPDARGIRRVFSITSPPSGDGQLRIATTLPLEPGRPSSFKRALARLEPGASLRASRIAGDFALPQDRSTPLLLIAGGVGITPFLAQLPEITCRDAVLVHAVRDAGDLAYVAELAAAGVRIVVVSPAPVAALPPNWTAVQGRLDADVLRDAVPDLKSRHALIAGSPAMAVAARDAVRAGGGRRFTVDAFTGS
jgi:glycine betaine catabolism B